MSTALLVLMMTVAQTGPVQAAPAVAGPDTVAVCPDAMREALQPWIDYRTKQGHSIAVVSAAGTAEQIRGQIRQAAKAGRLKFVLLVGDADPRMQRDPDVRAACVPTHHAKAKINVLWGSEPEIATDNWYADLDDDQIPDLAIGRLTADSPEELTAMIKKIVAYERSTDFSPWRRRVNFIAGVGGFGALADMVLESAARYFLTRLIPPEYRISMTYGSWRSPYCPDPRRFGATTIARFNEGAWFWVYIGHGGRTGVDYVRTPDGHYRILDNVDMPKLKCKHAAPIGLFLSCYAGAMDGPVDCLAEDMLRSTGGPVAVIAGSRVTMPYAMTVMSMGLMDECFEKRRNTIGEALLGAKRKMMQKSTEDDRQRAMLEAIARAISPAPEKLAEERAEHLLLFNLIGDPLMRLRHPKQVKLDAPDEVVAGGTFEYSLTSPVAGRCTVELAVRRDQLTFTPERRTEYSSSPDVLAGYQTVYERANDGRFVVEQVEVAADKAHAGRIKVPENARGDCHLRVFVEGAGDFSCGAKDVKIQKAKVAAASAPALNL